MKRFRQSTHTLAIAIGLLLSPAHGDAQSTSRATDLPTTPPASQILDSAQILDKEATDKLATYLKERLEKDNIQVYLATFPSLPESDFPADRAKQLGLLWFGDSPAKTTFGGVLVYAADSQKFGLALTPAVMREEGATMAKAVNASAKARVEKYASLSEALSESALDFEYSVRQIRDGEAAERSLMVPLLAAGGIIAIVLAIIIVLIILKKLRLYNFFGRAYVTPYRVTTHRLGGSHTGGHAVSLSFRPETSQAEAAQAPIDSGQDSHPPA